MGGEVRDEKVHFDFTTTNSTMSIERKSATGNELEDYATPSY